jgi:peptidoglycan/LPS O-acetylase OafA/YrhL
MLIMPAARSMSGAAGLGAAGIFALATILSVAVASVSYWTFEHWFNNLRDRFRAGSTMKRPPSPAAHASSLPKAPQPAVA